MKPKYNLPKREFCKGDGKKMISLRLHESLLEEINKVADDFGWTATDVIVTAVDQFAQWAKSEKKRK